ncbi:phytoene/squalene synthase family protein [Flavobacterium rhizosphaerae]|uniref:Phytoene/squalene synthase family protein n=1 Tax=Flavobacterium rhizosphaerae TaxID=3163298 RepID=A0ABW8Z0C9_9FLAO
MKATFDHTSYKASKLVTHQYSTSFSLGTRLLGKKIRWNIYAIYGFVRFADEIVDSFLDYNRQELLERFIKEYHTSLQDNISLNPIINSFQEVVLKYEMQELVEDFLRSMKMDLNKIDYDDADAYKAYIYGSADVVGLMCLKVFVDGDKDMYEQLKPYAMKLGSAFQKVNFLRDYANDIDNLGRSYFPNINFDSLDEASKNVIIEDIKADFKEALTGVRQLPASSRFGVLLAYKYYVALLKKLNRKSALHIRTTRTRVPDYYKGIILCKTFIRNKINWI